MKKILIAIGFLAFSVFLVLPLCRNFVTKIQPSATTPRPMSEADGEEKEARLKAYFEKIHRAAPGTDWRKIESQNAINNLNRFNSKDQRTTSSFAGGYINGVWHERGNSNIAGRVNSFAFLPSASSLYCVADGGSVWKTSLPTVSWTKISDKLEYNPYVLSLMPYGAGARVFLANSTTVWHTDNDGATLDTSAGIHFPVAWGGNEIYRVVCVNDVSNTVYCVTYVWDDVAWAPMFYLYSSTDNGLTFSLIRKLNYANTDQLAFCSPEGSGTLYALGVSGSGNDTLYSINSGIVSIAGATNAFGTDNSVDMKCVVSGGTTHFYALTGGVHVYHSTDFGNDWLLKSTIPNSYIIGVSAVQPNIVTYGGVDAYRSTDSGTTWTIINSWGSYYGAIATNLHADLRNFSTFTYLSGSEFGMIGTDGGGYISNDYLATVNNISMTGLLDGQLWDHISDPNDTNNIFGGAQDQGFQATNAGGGFGLLNSNQVISGDYGHLRITGGSNAIWIEYPGGDMYVYGTPGSPTYLCSWSMSGTQKPLAGWLLATADYFTSSTQNIILIGGGEISGGPGSYLSMLTFDAGTSSVTPSQYPYNFRANSNDTTAGISSIAVSHIGSSLMYVATEDGTFFYSTDAGTSWTKTLSFAGLAGNWLYGSAILPGVDSLDKVYFAGSGYSNPPVYVSRDHGQTFTAMSNGLPSTLVNTLAAYKNDSFIFAATEAGPYVYVKAIDTWYSLADSGCPVVNWRSVEYIDAIKTIRFGTYGRGIWHLRLQQYPTSVPEFELPETNITLAPNPTKNGNLLSLISNTTENVTLAIYSLNGKIVFNSLVSTNSPIHLPDLPIDIYVCEIAAPGEIQHKLLNIN